MQQDKALKEEVNSLKRESEELQNRLNSIEKLLMQVVESQNQSQPSISYPEPQQYQPFSVPISGNLLPAIPSSDLFPVARSQLQQMPQQIQPMQPALTYFSSSNNSQKRYWDQPEHVRYLEASYQFGSKDAVKISSFVGTRTADQVRSHQQKYQARVDKCYSDGRQFTGSVNFGLRQFLSQNSFKSFDLNRVCFDLMLMKFRNQNIILSQFNQWAASTSINKSELNQISFEAEKHLLQVQNKLKRFEEFVIVARELIKTGDPQFFVTVNLQNGFKEMNLIDVQIAFGCLAAIAPE
ncbi:Myb-like_DNA-binding domain-containing protein [Hexamita inflata]|uniref:Myb-like DNA-binding domain-containing protein n=1 Tax=Hexamita inflata TaxID=28002 RepID=A0AA86U8Q3_9EUKA|nr:Myb-like DNA-binding domain-containing protein [Hexamita inflata]